MTMMETRVSQDTTDEEAMASMRAHMNQWEETCTATTTTTEHKDVLEQAHEAAIQAQQAYKAADDALQAALQAWHDAKNELERAQSHQWECIRSNAKARKNGRG